MDSILKILLVLKLTLILLILTAGMGIVSEPTNTFLEQKITEDEVTIYQETNSGETDPDQNCPHKSSLGDLRLYIEL